VAAEADGGDELEDPCERLGTRWKVKTWPAALDLDGSMCC
jgi:hypothetical protein